MDNLASPCEKCELNKKCDAMCFSWKSGLLHNGEFCRDFTGGIFRKGGKDSAGNEIRDKR